MTGEIKRAFGLALITAALLAAVGAGLRGTAHASMQVSIGNPNLEHFDSDGAVTLNFGLTDNNGQPVGNLRLENLKIFEDGKPARILDFRGQGQGRPVDIVFIMDITESMQPYIDAVKQNVIAFAQDLASNNRDYRLGLVTFEDFVVSADPERNLPYRNKMTSNVQEFTQWVSGLHAGGGGDIPEDQLDALAYASKLPFRPDAESILILITDAPPHVAGDGSARSQHDQAYWDYRSRHPELKNADVTDLTADKVAAMLKRQDLTLYAVVPPPFIAPEYAEIVKATHGKSYNIITEEGRFASLVRELGHSIATEYTLTYRTPRPIEDGTNRQVQLKIDYNSQTGTAETSYQVRGIGGAAINVPEDGAGTGASTQGGVGLTQLRFTWWNGAVPLVALLALFGLSRAKFGVSAEELKAILASQSEPPRGPIAAPPHHAQPPAQATAARPPAPPPAGAHLHPRLVTLHPMDPVPSEYSLLKDELSLGRGEDNDIVIPHVSVSRSHARLVRRDGGYELTDLNSTNGTFANNREVHGSVFLAHGSEVKFGDVAFTLRG